MSSPSYLRNDKVNLTRKNINIKISSEAHKALKLLCVARDKTQAMLVEQMIADLAKKDQS